MIAIIAVCAVLLPNPSDLQPVERVTNAPQIVHQSSEAVAMSDYQEAQIEWYQYYGEWATGGNAGEAEASAAKSDAATGNEAGRKTSSK